MVNQINDIASQASQGSIAAIIQVLNDKLAHSGVRTRAVFDGGVLQLLCEARTTEKLDKSTLVQQIKQILESIAPRNVHRVNINSRIVREQQLLWLEEINRDPENQLLWSEQITLKKPNVLKQIIKDFKENKKDSLKAQLPQPQSSRYLIVNNKSKAEKSFLRGIMNLLGLCILLLSAGSITYYFFGNKINSLVNTLTKTVLKTSTSNQSEITSLQTTNINQNQLKTPVITTTSQTSQVINSKASQKTSQSEDDIFAVAVRVANEAVEDRKITNTSAEWLELAQNWQYASDLMAEVPSTHSRFKEAQSRIKLYKKYSELALKEANKN